MCLMENGVGKKIQPKKNGRGIGIGKSVFFFKKNKKICKMSEFLNISNKQK